MLDWMTNDPAVAKAFRATDRAHDKARAAAANLTLAEKVAAYSAAKAARQDVYDAIKSWMGES